MHNDKPVREFRCSHCRGLLGDEYIFAGRLFIKCHRCNTLNEIEFRTTVSELVNYMSKYFDVKKTIDTFEKVYKVKITKGGDINNG